MLQQKRPAEGPRKKPPSRGMLFGIRHGEEAPLVRLRGELGVPLRLAETAADAVNDGEAFGVADGDFYGRDSDYTAVFGV